jgi:hypothetical protein
MADTIWMIRGDGPAERALADCLAARAEIVPCEVDRAERWRDAAVGGAEKFARVVVAAWPPVAAAGAALLSTPPEAWLARAEDPIARWVFALGVAAARCADGGAIVAVLERPAPLDSAGFAPESAVADAASALVRSLARSEGPRGVRVNAVATSVRIAPAQPVAPAPALASFPGALEREVAGAVRMLLGADASGVTGQVLAADCGRTW